MLGWWSASKSPVEERGEREAGRGRQGRLKGQGKKARASRRACEAAYLRTIGGSVGARREAATPTDSAAVAASLSPFQLFLVRAARRADESEVRAAAVV
jgi:hypothetical protein